MPETFPPNAAPTYPAAAGGGARVLPWAGPSSPYDAAFRRALDAALAAAPALAAARAAARRRVHRLLARSPAQRRLLLANLPPDRWLAAALVEAAEARLGRGDARTALGLARLAGKVLRRLGAGDREDGRARDVAASAWRVRALALTALGETARSAAALARCRRHLRRGTGDRLERLALAEARVWWLVAVGRGRDGARLARAVRGVREARGG